MTDKKKRLKNFPKLPKPKRMTMDKVADRLRDLCIDFYQLVCVLSGLTRQESVLLEQLGIVTDQRQVALERLDQIRRNVEDLAQLAGWWEMLAQVDGVTLPEIQPKEDDDDDEEKDNTG